MKTNLSDAAQRQLALDPKKSFIVQAPAGSGKTELLTQRFLVLLSQVLAPEEILAITFTKKSAAEMRARIIQALDNASQEPLTSLSPHAEKTRQLALAVLERNQTHRWNLVNNPNRLRIQTIDSFNASLTKQLPILSHFGAAPDITNDSFALYQEAVQEFLSHLEDEVTWSDAIAQLLVHMDNDLQRVETLLINMLAKRDQWLPYITYHMHHPSLRAQLESHLTAVTQEALKNVLTAFPMAHADELLRLAKLAAEQLKRTQVSSPITKCAELTALPRDQLQDKIDWLALSELLLTKEYEWRKRFDKNIGFLPPTAATNPEEKLRLTQMKQDMSELMLQFHAHEDLKLALMELNLAPASQYHEAQWQTLNALHQVLLVTVAQLKLVFQQHGRIDYIENSQAALLALGADETPTDIALALDYQIKHILVDEFQDTSHSQYRLLEKLTIGWEDQDGRTLFAVGDPMQSIYRFREAEVGLFIRSQKKGLGLIKLIPLTLSVNFRSTPDIVNWINQSFEKVLPIVDDVATGAVSYSHSMANEGKSLPSSFVQIHPVLEDRQAEQANQIVTLIQTLKSNQPTESIAILVRSRQHLLDIMPALKKAGIAYRAIEIDALTTRPVIQDLMALTRALTHPADRIAWLAILRAPWCGLTLSDLLLLAGGKPHNSIFACLQESALQMQLSAEGQARVQRVLPILQKKIAARQRYPLRLWIESAWMMLGGPACLDQSTDLEDVQAYFRLLEKLDHGCDISHLDKLSDHVSQLYASPNHDADLSLQIMTIHNAKGLEFDTVILPHLERRSPHDEKQLLLWMERSSVERGSSLIIAPVHAIGEETDSIYEYIKRQHAVKADYETGRLLYVAATRAKKQLHLFFNMQMKECEASKPFSGSLLGKMWPAIRNTVETEIGKTHGTSLPIAPIEIASRPLKRLAQHWRNPVIELELSDSIAYHQKQSGFLLPDNQYKNIGQVTHQILQSISIKGISWWQTKKSEECTDLIRHKLIQLNTHANVLMSAINAIQLAIHQTLQDERGRWILQAHSEAAAELSLTTVVNQSAKTYIIDRTFIDEKGVRWIIDYKITPFTSGQLDHFLQEEQKKYAQQMQQYCQAMREMETREIRLGLYFPLIPAWREWETIGKI